MQANSRKRQVSYAQLNALLEFLKDHRELARGMSRGRQGHFHTLKNWRLCAKKLNALEDGVVKDAKGWSKYWCDWKYRVKRRALEFKAAEENNRPPPDGVSPLSSMEEDILGIIGENAVDKVVIKYDDPLGDRDSNDDQDNNDNNYEDEASLRQNDDVKFRSKSKRYRVDNASDVDDLAGPSSPLNRIDVENDTHFGDTDCDDEASEFLRLEREKLNLNKQMAESIKTMQSDIARLVNVMSHIRDVIANNTIHS